MQWIKPGTNIDFVGAMKFWGLMSVILIALAYVGIAVRGFNWGIDFAGGTELQIRFAKDVKTADIRKTLESVGFEKNEVQPYGDPTHHEYLVRIERITSLTEERIDALRTQAVAHFGADKLRSFVFEPTEGDRVAMEFALEPAAEVSGAPASLPAGDAPESQAASLPASLPAALGGRGSEADAPAGLSEERQANQLKEQVVVFFRGAGVELRLREPIMMGQPRNGRVEALVYFKGVSDRIIAAMVKDLGKGADCNLATDPERCGVDNRRTEYVDSNVSKELRTDGLLALLYAMIAMLVYIAIRFDFYSAPGAIVAIFHDVSIAAGFFAWTGLEFNLQTIAALLTVLGYSINDTIVVYDRVRETTPGEDKLKDEKERERYVNRAINDVLSRTILTTVVTMLVVVALVVFSTGSVKNFAIGITVGFLVGTYSSIFVASSTGILLHRLVPARKS
ncbi:MAG: protein translocase subunit SecF [Deltaproteobacteria bacterium]|nr:protein translocase subunit SecF [Deltaproteobacteria bacterium]